MPYLILRGLLWGNGIGIAILLLEIFGIIKLNPENYYVDQARISKLGVYRIIKRTHRQYLFSSVVNSVLYNN
jgi:hypothetical protein